MYVCTNTNVIQAIPRQLNGSDCGVFVMQVCIVIIVILCENYFTPYLLSAIVCILPSPKHSNGVFTGMQKRMQIP